jgi:tetratricopeptide (TPR) repeat protein
MADLIYTASDERPKGIAALAVLQILGGAMTIASIVLGNWANSESLSGSGLSWSSLSAPLVVYGALGIAAGIGMWRGKAWGWWLAAFSYVHGIVRNVGSLLAIPDLLDMFGEPAQGVDYYYAREIVQIGGALLIGGYWFRRKLLTFFGLADLSRLRAVLTLTGISILVVGGTSLLPGTVDRDLERIVGIYEQGDVPAAIDEFEVYLESHPDDDLAWTIYGHANLDVDAYEKAEAAYERALEINPERAEAWTGLGILYRWLGDGERAMECYEKALAIEPNSADAYTGMAVLALYSYEDAQALEYAEKAYELDKRSPVVVANLAVAYHFNGMYEERDAMTTEAERLGYDGIDVLQMIYDGELTIRE